MPTRREFLVTAAWGLGSVGPMAWSPAALAGGAGFSSAGGHNAGPLIASTWHFGLQANEAAWSDLASGGDALDAVETAARVPEADPSIHSVGLGGYPDRDGRVTLDACIMDHRGEAGSVAFLPDIVHAVSVARRVMTETPHVMLAGAGAHAFARQQGFPSRNLLTPEMDSAWRKWLQESHYQPRGNWERYDEGDGSDNDSDRPADGHDTIGVLARDSAGNLAGACTTSGAPYKMHGRIGDSPIIGAALFVDNEVGAACATGLGERVMKTCGSFLVVELMRQGLAPEAACRAAVERIVAESDEIGDLQVGYLALARDGRVGSFAIQPGFQIAVHDSQQNRLSDAPSWT